MMTKKIAEGAPSEEVRETDWEWEGPFSEGEYQILAPDRIIAVVYRKQDVDKILNALAAPSVVDPGKVRGSLTNVLCNASNFPEPHRILGKDVSKVIDVATEAVVEALGGGR